MDVQDNKLTFDNAVELKKMELAENIRGTKKRLDYLIAAFDCAAGGYQPNNSTIHHGTAAPPQHHRSSTTAIKTNSGPSSLSSVSSLPVASTLHDGTGANIVDKGTAFENGQSSSLCFIVQNTDGTKVLEKNPIEGGTTNRHSDGGSTAVVSQNNVTVPRSNHYAYVTAVSTLCSKNPVRQVQGARSDIGGTKDPKMVQERVWSDIVNHQNISSEEEEEIDYRLPGIVKRMKDKYMSLALKQNNTWSRPTILRKATSLENILDDEKFMNTTEDEDGDDMQGDETKRDRNRFDRRVNGKESSVTLRYHRSSGRRTEMKRARSVEPISRTDDVIVAFADVTSNNRQSLHEDMLLINMAAETDYEKPHSKQHSMITNENELNSNNLKQSVKMNRPKRLQPIVSENEKPPVDFVKQVKMIFEKRPEQRTKKPPHTGDVAAKIDNFNSIIVKAKAAKKPPIKLNKPVLNDKPKSNTHVSRPHGGKPVSLTEDVTASKPKSLDLKNIQQQRVSPTTTRSPTMILSPTIAQSPTTMRSPTTILSPTANRSPTAFLYSPNRERASPLSPNRNLNYYNDFEKDNDVFIKNYNNKKSAIEDRYKNKPADLKINQKPKDDTLSSPIPDVSRTDYDSDTSNINSSLSETPDLLLTASLLPVTSSQSPTFEKKHISDDFIQAEKGYDTLDTNQGYKYISPTGQSNISKNSASTTFNFTSSKVEQTHLPTISNGHDNYKSTNKAPPPPLEPLRIEVNSQKEALKPTSRIDVSYQNGTIDVGTAARNNTTSPIDVATRKTESSLNANKSATVTKPPPSRVISPPPSTNSNSVVTSTSSKPTAQVKSSDSAAETVNMIVLGKKKRQQDSSTTTTVFDFTGRKDVPDYISNDKSRSPARPELPKTGEGGIIRLPGSLFEESFLDEEEEILRSLERPPSPCDVTFINDNILIEGRSSLSQSAKKNKMRIKFIEEAEVFEYPSETSLLIDEKLPSPISNNAQVGHQVPILSGSSLANYTPKLTGEFQPGISRTVPIVSEIKPTNVSAVEPTSDLIIEEADVPFSAGRNSDMLF